MNNIQVTSQNKVEKTSKIILWVLTGISLVILALFVLIGYDNIDPEEDTLWRRIDTIDAVLLWTYFLIAVAIIATIGAVIYSFINGSGKSLHAEKGLASKANLIAWGTFIVSVAIGLIIGFQGKDEVLLINGKDWNNATDIILTDTSMMAILILTIVTVLVTVYSMIAKAMNK